MEVHLTIVTEEQPILCVRKLKSQILGHERHGHAVLQVGMAKIQKISYLAVPFEPPSGGGYHYHAARFVAFNYIFDLLKLFSGGQR